MTSEQEVCPLPNLLLTEIRLLFLLTGRQLADNQPAARISFILALMELILYKFILNKASCYLGNLIYSSLGKTQARK